MKDFEETKALSREELQAALATGDPRDRVLAIWALALRTPEALSFNHHVRGEPDPGVRRALAVVLAAHGELDLLVAMSRHDPNVFVRASTTQILFRFAVAGQVPWSLVVERMADSAEVRAAVLSQIDETSPEILRDAAVKTLRDLEPIARREAFETCARLARAGALDVAFVVEEIERARYVEQRHLIAVWETIIGPEAVRAHLAYSDIPPPPSAKLGEGDLVPVRTDDDEWDEDY